MKKKKVTFNVINKDNMDENEKILNQLESIGSLEKRQSIKNYRVSVSGNLFNNNTLNVTSIDFSSGDVSITGYLVDLFCVNNQQYIALDTKADLRIQPGNHSAYCLYDVPQCINSGYGILVMENENKMYKLHWTLDLNGNNMAKELLKSLGTIDDRRKIYDYQVTVTGTINNNNFNILMVKDIKRYIKQDNTPDTTNNNNINPDSTNNVNNIYPFIFNLLLINIFLFFN